MSLCFLFNVKTNFQNQMTKPKSKTAISTSSSGGFSTNRAVLSNTYETNSSSYLLRPRKNGQVIPPSISAPVTASKDVSSLTSLGLNPKVVLEDISDFCATVQSVELDRQVYNHSADPLLAKDKGCLSAFPERFPILWPSMNEDSKWNALEEAIMRHLTTASQNLPPGARIQFLETTIYDCASKAFGHSFPRAGHPVRNSCPKKKKTIELVKVKNDLLIQIEVCCNPSEREGLSKLLEATRVELRKLRKVGNRRKKRWLRKRQRESFKANPYKCGKDLLTPKNFSKLTIPTAELDKILKSLHADPSRDIPLPPLEGLPDPPAVKVEFDTSPPSFESFMAVVKTRRNRSRPGPNIIPYKLYKKCLV